MWTNEEKAFSVAAYLRTKIFLETTKQAPKKRTVLIWTNKFLTVALSLTKIITSIQNVRLLKRIWMILLSKAQINLSGIDVRNLMFQKQANVEWWRKPCIRTSDCLKWITVCTLSNGSWEIQSWAAWLSDEARPHSLDLTPLDFMLWGYLKSKVCVNKPDTIRIMK